MIKKLFAVQVIAILALVGFANLAAAQSVVSGTISSGAAASTSTTTLSGTVVSPSTTLTGTVVSPSRGGGGGGGGGGSSSGGGGSTGGTSNGGQVLGATDAPLIEAADPGLPNTGEMPMEGTGRPWTTILGATLMLGIVSASIWMARRLKWY